MAYILMGEPLPLVLLWAMIVSIIAFFSALICALRGMSIGSLIGSSLFFFGLIMLMGLDGMRAFQVLRRDGVALVDQGDLISDAMLHVVADSSLPALIFVFVSVLMRRVWKAKRT
ncbi:MAG TPA: hypothetical protein PK752_03580 [Accumulibacter sp.]|uniref:hypothetical protein n=1 Tax=Accumulibacter sp. TaxID=2053492 RepID=UPI002B61F945|nr:hypothetical protein [Accumulibacter sp.]HRD87329.1 hypothetical protein [Accumulibacter sp.]